MDLKRAIREAGLNQRELADALDVSEATVSQWVAYFVDANRGRRVPAEYVPRLAAMLKVERHALRPDLYEPPLARRRSKEPAQAVA